MGLWLERRMKTTIEVPDDLYRRAKSIAALRGRRLKDLIEDERKRGITPDELIYNLVMTMNLQKVRQDNPSFAILLEALLS